MATIKSYTDLEQSRKLAEILPLESADMFHFIHEVDTVGFGYKKDTAEFYSKTEFEYLPCWSLAALLELIPNPTLVLETTDSCELIWGIGEKDCDGMYEDFGTIYGNTPIDACVATIEELHKLKLL